MIEQAGVQLQHIPGGCTGMCQPVDVGINKPFKCCMHGKWQEWLIHEGIQNENRTKSTGREEIAHWIIESIGRLDERKVKRAWRPSEMSYFPDDL